MLKSDKQKKVKERKKIYTDSLILWNFKSGLDEFSLLGGVSLARCNFWFYFLLANTESYRRNIRLHSFLIISNCQLYYLLLGNIPKQ